MSHILRKIRSFRKIKKRYTKLQNQATANSNQNTQTTARDTMALSGDTSEGIGEDSDQETLGEEITVATTSDTSGEQGDEISGGDKQTNTADESEADDSAEEENEADMDWESTSGGSDSAKEREDNDDEALGEVELSELLQLEKEQPDEFLPDLEVPTRPKSPKSASNNGQENFPTSTGTMSFDSKHFEWEGEEDEEYPIADFIRTEVFISDAEWWLQELLPYKQYRAKSPSCLRTCYTVIVQEDDGTME
jgi:hypothetical protein